MFDLGDILSAYSAYDAFIALDYNQIQGSLKALEEGQIEALAYHLALSCPPKDLSAFKRNTVSCFASNASAFSTSLSEALDIALNIKMLTDAKMATPYIMLTKRFNAPLFKKFPKLANDLLEKCSDDQKKALSKKLQDTPTDMQSTLLENVKVAFGDACYLVLPLTSSFARASANTLTQSQDKRPDNPVPLSPEFELKI